MTSPPRAADPLIANRRQGTITAVNVGPPPTVTITIGADTTTTVDVPYRDGFQPAVNDEVVILSNQGSHWVVGKNDTGTANALLHVRQTNTPNTLANGAWGLITFDAADVNTVGASMWTNAGGQGTTVNIPTTGIYEVSGGAGILITATMTRAGARLTKNGSPIDGSGQLIPGITVGTGMAVSCRTIIQNFTAGDQIRLEGFYTVSAGGPATLNTSITNELQSSLSMRRLT